MDLQCCHENDPINLSVGSLLKSKALKATLFMWIAIDPVFPSIRQARHQILQEGRHPQILRIQVFSILRLGMW